MIKDPFVYKVLKLAEKVPVVLRVIIIALLGFALGLYLKSYFEWSADAKNYNFITIGILAFGVIIVLIIGATSGVFIKSWKAPPVPELTEEIEPIRESEILEIDGKYQVKGKKFNTIEEARGYISIINTQIE
jgi:hypothetical protein